jgi:hypothetical protein
MSEKPIDRRVADRFMAEQWRPIAAAAWRFYLRHNRRGALLMNWKWVERWASGQRFSIDLIYLSQAEDPELQNLIEKYDPNTSVVMLFTTDDLATSGDNRPPGVDEGPQMGEIIGVHAGAALIGGIFTHEPSPREAHRGASH